jgi:hypothetical protein
MDYQGAMLHARPGGACGQSAVHYLLIVASKKLTISETGIVKTPAPPRANARFQSA